MIGCTELLHKAQLLEQKKSPSSCCWLWLLLLLLFLIYGQRSQLIFSWRGRGGGPGIIRGWDNSLDRLPVYHRHTWGQNNQSALIHTDKPRSASDVQVFGCRRKLGHLGETHADTGRTRKGPRWEPDPVAFCYEANFSLNREIWSISGE